MNDLDEFVRLHERPLHNFALQLTRSADDAEDLLQDTWIKCLIHQPMLAGMSTQKQRSWLFSVLKNRWLDICRHRKLERLAECQPVRQHQDSFPAHRMAPHLDKLPDLERDIVHRKYWLGCNSRQIAADLGIPEGTVRWRLKLALEKLKNMLLQSDKEELCPL